MGGSIQLLCMLCGEQVPSPGRLVSGPGASGTCCSGCTDQHSLHTTLPSLLSKRDREGQLVDYSCNEHECTRWRSLTVIILLEIFSVIELAINRVLCIVNGAQALVGIILSIASCRKISAV